jgi:hypothetical protein
MIVHMGLKLKFRLFIKVYLNFIHSRIVIFGSTLLASKKSHRHKALLIEYACLSCYRLF